MKVIACAAVVVAVAGVVQAVSSMIQALASKRGQKNSNAEFLRHNLEVERIMRKEVVASKRYDEAEKSKAAALRSDAAKEGKP